MNLWMDTAQTRWTARHKQHIRQEACFFAGGSVGTKLGTGIAQASIAGIMSLCGYISSTVPGMAARLCRESVSPAFPALSAPVGRAFSVCVPCPPCREADIHKKFIAAALRLSALLYIINAEHIPMSPLPITERFR